MHSMMANFVSIRRNKHVNRPLHDLGPHLDLYTIEMSKMNALGQCYAVWGFADEQDKVLDNGHA